MARFASPWKPYRNRIMTASRLARVGVLVATFVVLVVTGLVVEAVQATVGAATTQVVTWVVVLAALYTLYALVRSVFHGRGEASG